jgi:hypothetical protein
MVYHILANLILLLHLVFILFVLFGGLLAVKNARWCMIHVPAVLWGVLVEFADWVCPLTPFEDWLRAKAGAAALETDFIAHTIMPIIYPAEMTRSFQIFLGIGVILVNLLIYSFVLKRLVSQGNPT